jgi:hypothetical protein
MPPVRRSVQEKHRKAIEHKAQIQDALAKVSDGTYKSLRFAGDYTGVRGKLTECTELMLIMSCRLDMKRSEIGQVVMLKAGL